MTGFDRANDTLRFDPFTGGQGGEGMTSAGQWYAGRVSFFGYACFFFRSASQWYIENVLEEVDSAEEFYHDLAAGKLYYDFNASAPGAAPSEPQVLETFQNLLGTF